MSDDLLLMAWDGDILAPPTPYWAKLADQKLVCGERYLVKFEHERSAAQHRMFFASVGQIWQNLPDHLAERFASPDALRKAALIATGYRDERSIVASSKAEAQRLAAFVRTLDSEYSVVAVDNATVVVLTARSQSYRAMGRAAFKQSMDDVLNHLAGLIGTTPAAVQRNETA